MTSSSWEPLTVCICLQDLANDAIKDGRNQKFQGNFHQANLCEKRIKTFCYCMYPNQLTSCLFAVHLHQRWRCSLLGCPWRGRWNASWHEALEHWFLVDFSLIVSERPFKEKEMELDVSSAKHFCFYLIFGHKGLQCNYIHDLPIKPRKHISHH